MGDEAAKATPVLLMVEWPKGQPSLEEAARHLGLERDDLDPDFGVVPVDPQKKLFAVRGISSRAAKHSGASSDPAIGPFDS
jgi:hypothetical protein